MKYLGITLAVSLTLCVMLALVAFNFLPKTLEEVPPAEEQVVPTAPPVPSQGVTLAPVDRAQIESDLAQREAIYQDQIRQLEQAIQERQVSYQNQIGALNQQVAATQDQLAQLKAQEQALQDQLPQLEATRAERLGVYQAQLQQAQEQYQARYTEAQAYLADIQAKLVEVRTQLGQ